jgi:DNA-binding CsgD family transcriptional regulator
MKPVPKCKEASDLRATEFEIGTERFLVLSYALGPAAPRRGVGLTKAEAQVAQLVVAGRSNAEIARSRGTAVRTVTNQIAALFRKLHVKSRSELAARHALDSFDRDAAAPKEKRPSSS